MTIITSSVNELSLITLPVIELSPIAEGVSKTGFPLPLPFTDTFAALDPRWLNTGWGVSGGAAVAAITLGAELLTNGTFDADTNWTKGTGWSIASGAAAFAPGTFSTLSQNPPLSASVLYSVALQITALSAGGFLAKVGNAGGLITHSATGTYRDTGRQSGTTSFYIYPTSAAANGSVDNLSCKPIVFSSTLQLRDFEATDIDISVEVTIPATSGIQAGVALCWDNDTNPQTGAIAYYDRNDNHIKLYQFVSGVRSVVIDVAATYVAGAAVRVKRVDDSVQLYYNGTLVSSWVLDSSLTGTLSGMYATDSAASFDNFSISSSTGGITTGSGLFAIGDSKTNGDAWVQLLVGLLNADAVWFERPGRFAQDGGTVASLKTYMDTNLAAASGLANVAIFNLGPNDAATGLPAEATWKANYTAMIDAVIAKWPGISVYIAHPWRSTYLAEMATLNGWIDDIIASYASGVYAGTDERIWLENGDDGATYTSDGLHYNTAGNIENANQWYTTLTS